MFIYTLRIGFLGLGLMGSGIVSNLLKMGHTVTVWNRTAEKVGMCLTSPKHSVTLGISWNHLSVVPGRGCQRNKDTLVTLFYPVS